MLIEVAKEFRFNLNNSRKLYLIRNTTHERLIVSSGVSSLFTVITVNIVALKTLNSEYDSYCGENTHKRNVGLQ